MTMVTIHNSRFTESRIPQTIIAASEHFLEHQTILNRFRSARKCLRSSEGGLSCFLLVTLVPAAVTVVKEWRSTHSSKEIGGRDVDILFKTPFLLRVVIRGLV